MPSSPELQSLSESEDSNSSCFTQKFLADYYQYPIEQAAKILEMCPTGLKKECRALGINRWPHRVHKSLTDLINEISKSDLDKDTKENIIKRLEMKLSRLAENPNLKLKELLPDSEVNLIKRQLKHPGTAVDMEIDIDISTEEELKAISILANLSRACSTIGSFSNSGYSFFSLKTPDNNSKLYSMTIKPSNIELKQYRKSYIYCHDNLYYITEAADLLPIKLLDEGLFKQSIAAIKPEADDERLQFLTPKIVSKVITLNTLNAVESIATASLDFF